jgi:hypothetical protein
VTESVADDGIEVPSQEAETTEVEAPPATDFAAEATEYKNRFAGSQKKLTETLNAKKALDAEVEALRQFKATAERANMSELEALKADLALEREAAATARAEAQREKIARQFPQSAALLGDKMPTDEEVLTALEQRLAGVATEESEPEPKIDPNNPRKQTPTPPDPMDAVDRWMRSSFDNGGF